MTYTGAEARQEIATLKNLYGELPDGLEREIRTGANGPGTIIYCQKTGGPPLDPHGLKVGRIYDGDIERRMTREEFHAFVAKMRVVRCLTP